MFAVPWLIGWALRPYIQIQGNEAEARKSEKRLSAAVAKAQLTTVVSANAPTSPPGGSKAAAEPVPLSQEQIIQASVATKTAAARSAAAATAGPTKIPQIVKVAQPQQATPPEAGPATKVSTRTITLKMSAEWAQRQIEQFRFSFEEADRDKSGWLSFAEVLSVLDKAGFKGTPEEAKKIFGHLDLNQDEKITRDEFTVAMNNLPRITIKEFVLRKVFKALDKDGSGTLSRPEIEDATKKEAGLDIAADKIAELLIVLSKDTKDDHVDYEEFLRVFGVQSTATVMHGVFQKLDADKSGFLTKDEILLAVQAESELTLRADKIADLLIYWCKDKDKKIDYNEFVQVWLKQK